MADILITLTGKYTYYKNNFYLTDWIKELRKCRDNNASIDDYEKFVEWKLEDYKLFGSDKRIIEAILLYEYK